MKKEEENLQRKIEEIIKGRKDKDEARKKVQELLDLKDEMSVVPVEIMIPSDTVKDEVSVGPITLMRTKNEVVYKHNGYFLVVKPWNKRLFDVINIVIDMCKLLDKKEDKKLRTLRDAYISVLKVSTSLPEFIFMDDKFMTDMYKIILEKLENLLEAKSKKIESEDIESDNEEFRRMVELLGGDKDGE